MPEIIDTDMAEPHDTEEGNDPTLDGHDPEDSDTLPDRQNPILIPDLDTSVHEPKPQTKALQKKGPLSLATKRVLRDIRNTALIAHEAEARSRAVSKLDRAIEDAKLSDVTESDVRRLLGNERFITEVMDLNMLFESVFEKLELVRNLLTIKYNEDPQTGKPMLDDENWNQFSNQMGVAKIHIQNMRADAQKRTEQTQLFTPENALLKQLEDLNRNPHKFLNPHEASRIIKSIDDYLRALIESTQIGMQVDIQTLQAQFAGFFAQTMEIDRQKQYADEVDIDIPQHTIHNWQDLVESLESALGQHILKLEKIFGPNAAWLLSKVELDHLNRLRMRLIEKEERTSRLIVGLNDANNTAPGFMTKLLTQKNQNKPENKTKLIQERKALREQRGVVERMIDQRSNMDQQLAILQDDEEMLENQTENQGEKS